MSASPLSARVGSAVSDFAPQEWDALAGTANPFTRHAFLAALEQSGSVGPGTGWQSAPIALEDEGGALLGLLPAYAKGHGQGEYVFDHGWADAWERAGGAYYPKLQIAAPFTPATGPRLLLADPAHAPALIAAAEQVTLASGFSSAHATFLTEGDAGHFAAAGWLARRDIQFHWHNRGFASFDDFLGTLASRKRKALRKERAAAQSAVTIRHLTGSDLRPEHWDAFWEFYQDTGARKWGTPYLTRSFFDLVGETMADQILLVLAYQEGEPIAGALNFIGGDALYGRYWGCTRDVPFLHFELCYYQAIDAAIALGLGRVEAGAQGGHKLARGYEPVETRSAHFIADPGFRRAVAEFLERERQGIAADRLYLERAGPFRRGG